MRIASLLVLMFLLPAFTHAALININTADKETLMELEGIGDVLAGRIIGYREANGPFSTIEELIHPNIERLYQSTFDKIKGDITVGDTETPDPTPPVATSTAATTTTATAGSSGGPPPEYIPIPTLRVITSGDRTVSSGADVAFTAAVYDGNRGNRRDDAHVVWSFGDGMQRTGARVYHAYYSPGEYVVAAHVSTSDGGDALVENIVTAKDASVQITTVSARGISLANNSSRTLDLSLWRLSSGGKEFQIPTGTHILGGRMILFPSQVIQLPIASSASLLYPNGEVATAYPPVPVAQLPSSPVSFNKVQAVESSTESKGKPTISSTETSTGAYEKAAIAPTAATELAAVGAASSATLPADSPKTGGIFRSPWFVGLMGVIALAGGAFIFL